MQFNRLFVRPKSAGFQTTGLIGKLLKDRAFLKALSVGSLILAVLAVLRFEDVSASQVLYKNASGSPSSSINTAELPTPTHAIQLIPSGRLGRGRMDQVTWSPDGRTIAVASSIGVWLYSSAAEDTSPRLLEGHAWAKDFLGQARLAFSPDSTMLAFVDTKTDIRVWEVSSGKLLYAISGFASPVNTVLFSPDGRSLVTGIDGMSTARDANDQRTPVKDILQFWDAKSGRLLHSLRLPNGEIDSVDIAAFSPDGKILASAESSNISSIVRLWSVEDGNLVQTLDAKTDNLEYVLFSPNGTTLTVLYDDSWLRVWEIPSGKLLISTDAGQNLRWRLRASYSPDGQTLATGNYQGEIQLWDMASGKLKQTLNGQTKPINALSYSQDGKTLASGGDDSIVLLDVNNSQVQRTLTGHSGMSYFMAFSPDNKTLASVGWDDQLILWDVASGKPLNTLTGYSWDANSVAFSPDGNTLAVGYNPVGDGDTVRVWEVNTGKLLLSLYAQSEITDMVAFSPDGNTLAAGTMYAEVKLWDVKTGQLLHTVGGMPPASPDSIRATAFILGLAFHQDGKTLVYGNNLGELAVVDVNSGTIIRTFSALNNSVGSLTFSPDGKTLATAGNYKVLLWDYGTGDLLQTLSSDNDGDVTSVVYTRDGSLLANGSEHNKVHVWDARSGQLIRILDAHSSNFPVETIAFSPDGKTLAAGSGDGFIRLWNVSDGALLEVHEYPEWITSIAFSPDGKLLVSASHDGTVQLWAILAQ